MAKRRNVVGSTDRRFFFKSHQEKTGISHVRIGGEEKGFLIRSATYFSSLKRGECRRELKGIVEIRVQRPASGLESSDDDFSEFSKFWETRMQNPVSQA
jgi:hypothetical protein